MTTSSGGDDDADGGMVVVARMTTALEPMLPILDSLPGPTPMAKDGERLSFLFHKGFYCEYWQ